MVARHPLARLAESPTTVALLAAQVAVLAFVTLRLGDATDAAVLVRAGALERGRVWSGEWWRLLTAAFLHIGWIHLAINVAFGFGWCRMVERALGSWRFLALWLCSAAAGSATSLLASDQVGAGASGALLGMIGAVLALHRRALPSWRAFVKSPPVIQVTVWLAIFTAVTLARRMPVDHAAHAGGLVAGAAGAWLLSGPSTGRIGRLAALGATLAVVCAAAVWPRPGLSRFGAGELEDQLIDALQHEDHERASALLARARSAGYHSDLLTFHGAVLLVQEGRLAEALTALEPLTGTGTGRIGLRARAVAANLRYQLATTPEAHQEAYRAIQAACEEGDPQSCRDAEIVRRGPIDP
jgi:rhomboid protease GluP